MGSRHRLVIIGCILWWLTPDRIRGGRVRIRILVTFRVLRSNGETLPRLVHRCQDRGGDDADRVFGRLGYMMASCRSGQGTAFFLTTLRQVRLLLLVNILCCCSHLLDLARCCICRRSFMRSSPSSYRPCIRLIMILNWASSDPARVADTFVVCASARSRWSRCQRSCVLLRLMFVALLLVTYSPAIRCGPC